MLEGYRARAIEFDKYTDEDREQCLRFGYFAEVGELMAVFDKHVRKCGGRMFEAVACPTCSPKLVDEGGDVLWFSAALHTLFARGVQMVVIDQPAKGRTLPENLQELRSIANAVSARNPGDVGWTTRADIELGLGCLEEIMRFCGATLGEVAELNLDKLAARATGQPVAEVREPVDLQRAVSEAQRAGIAIAEVEFALRRAIRRSGV